MPDIDNIFDPIPGEPIKEVKEEKKTETKEEEDAQEWCKENRARIEFLDNGVRVTTNTCGMELCSSGLNLKIAVSNIREVIDPYNKIWCEIIATLERSMISNDVTAQGVDKLLTAFKIAVMPRILEWERTKRDS